MAVLVLLEEEEVVVVVPSTTAAPVIVVVSASTAAATGTGCGVVDATAIPSSLFALRCFSPSALSPCSATIASSCVVVVVEEVVVVVGVVVVVVEMVEVVMVALVVVVLGGVVSVTVRPGVGCWHTPQVNGQSVFAFMPVLASLHRADMIWQLLAATLSLQ